MMWQGHKPDKIQVRGARVHNLKNIDVEVPLNQIVGIAGVEVRMIALGKRTVCLVDLLFPGALIKAAHLVTVPFLF